MENSRVVEAKTDSFLPLAQPQGSHTDYSIGICHDTVKRCLKVFFIHLSRSSYSTSQYLCL